MKIALKLLLPLFLITAFISGCKEDVLNPTGTVPNPNVKVYRNIVISEDFNATSRSGIDLYAGTNTASLDAQRDAEIADSTAIPPEFRDRFYVRSGDGTYDGDVAPGQKTRFFPFFNTRNTAYSQSAFDTITYMGAPGNLVPSDFSRNSLFSLGRTFVSGDIRVYGFWLEGKRVSLGLSKEVYGLMYLKSISTVNIGGVDTYQLTVDVKINTNGENDFRENIPVQ